jgi:serine phosphatase RsbU (regulator of sigma subunit)/anti-sigma regulatory factor (Ser/Thr protein kinase)
MNGNQIATHLRIFLKSLSGQKGDEGAAQSTTAQARAVQTSGIEMDIDPDDPIVAYFQTSPGAVEISKITFDSPALRAMKAAGVKIVVPLVSQGELIGLLNLGSRLSEQDYSTDDRGLLNNLATQAAPALRIAQLVRQQQVEAQERERIEQELRVARLIQQTLLPKDLPHLPGWQVAAYYQPARAVGGDFYDFIHLPDGRLCLIIGDVTDKGVPAALVMATTRSILRSATEQFHSPGLALERANEQLCPDIPPNMFVTCLYAVLDPRDGHLVYANAGHDPPYRRSQNDVEELRARGMPLGLLPGMQYEQKETTLLPGDSVLFYSDGLVEAHNPQREMFGFPRLRSLLAGHPGGSDLIDHLLAKLSDFTTAGWEQEDDVTFMVLERQPEPTRPDPAPLSQGAGQGQADPDPDEEGEPWQVLADFNLPSQPGNERLAMEQVGQALSGSHLAEVRLERLKTAVAEATMNAMEHGNHYQPDQPVFLRVLSSPRAVKVQISDHGGGQNIPEPEAPDLEAKLAGLQTPRGWGLFLIKNMVDEMNAFSDEATHTVELILYLEGE